MSQELEIHSGDVVVNPLQELVDTLEYQKSLKRDIVVPSYEMRYDPTTNLMVVGDEQLKLSDLAHMQVAGKLEIPTGYYKRMLRDNHDLLANNINGWLSKKEKTKYLLRTFNYGDSNIQNVCRAMLSNRYNILDNFDVLVAALEAIKNTGINIQIETATVTDTRMYLHVIAPDIHVEATKLLDGYLEDRATAVTGKGIVSGFLIQNSEVGLGTFECSALAQILKCKNGLHDRAARFRKVHLGGKMDEGIVDWSQNTKNKNYELIIAQIQDSVKTYLSTDYLGQLTTRLQGYKDYTITKPTQVIEKVSLELGLIDEQRKESVLKHFLCDNDSSSFGMLNAFTRVSQTMDADTRYETESKVFDLLPKIHQFDKASKN